MRIIQPPKIIVNTFPNNTLSWKTYELADIFPNKIVFDSDRLEHDPSPRFKDLSIGDFDLYTATVFLFTNNVLPLGYTKTEVDCNRIDRTFRIRMVGLRDGMSYVELKKNGNDAEMEDLLNILNSIFGLVDSYEMSNTDFERSTSRIEDMLSFAFRVHRSDGIFNIYKPEMGVEVAGEDVALILRKMLPRPKTVYDNWIRSYRGRRMFVTHEHPELLW